jgi:hypothetical protein
MIFFSENISPRLRYMADHLGMVLAEETITLTSNRELYLNATGAKINYSSEPVDEKEIWILPAGLLHETGVRPQVTDCFEVNGYPAFFKTTGGSLPFDIFSAGFYLLSRYEEYGPHTKDEYGRYAHTNALAFKEDFLSHPLVDYWWQELRTLLQQQFPDCVLRKTEFSFVPTYDIDMAWSYRHKGWWRNAGGFLLSVLSGQWQALDERVRVLRGAEPDPFDSYDWLNALHKKYDLQPCYFFLLAAHRGQYDKNISPSNKALQQLIKDIHLHHATGIHPSWQSGDKPALLKTEIDTLATITGTEVVNSRQHYIRFQLPHTYQQLLAAGIRFDFSMGYGSINGFRASTCMPFYWYDLEKETATDLLLYPFCFMEANAFYEQALNSEAALAEMMHYYTVVKKVNGQLFTIWHNSSLGTDRGWAGWRDMYEKLVAMVAESNPVSGIKAKS